MPEPVGAANRTHRLKIWPEPFQEVLTGRKPYEARVNDRDYRVGDLLVLAEWDPAKAAFTGRFCRRLVRHMTDSTPPSPLPEGVVVLGLSRQ